MSERLRAWLPWAVAALAVLFRIVPGPRIIDDAYITYRYAQNLVGGQGFVYNPGEYVLGTTTPLYTLILSSLGMFAGGSQAPYPEISWLLNAGLDAITCVLLIRLGARLGRPGAGWATAAIWAVAPMAVTFTIGGMETSLVISLIVATFYLHLRQRPTYAAFTASLALLGRPDAVLFVGPLLLEMARQGVVRWRSGERHDLMAQAAVLALPLLGWGLFATLYFGSPIPHSILAKAATYRLPANAALIRLLQHYATPFMGHLTFGIPWIGVGIILFPVLFVLGAVQTIRRRGESWALFASPWLYLAVYAIAHPLIFRWYLAPPLPFYFLGICFGAARVAEDVRRPAVMAAFALVALGLSLRGWVFHPDHGPGRPAPEMAYIELELLYEQVGRALNGRLEPGQVLAAGDIGALGYFSQARMLDTLGIISPRSLVYYPADPAYYAINYAIPPELVTELKPDYLVILEAYGRLGLLRDEAFQEAYRLEQRIPTDIYGSQGMLVYSRSEKP